MSYHLDNMPKISSARAKMEALPGCMQDYLRLAFQEAVEDPALCNGYDSSRVDLGHDEVRLVTIRIAKAAFALAIVANKHVILVDLQLTEWATTTIVANA